MTIKKQLEAIKQEAKKQEGKHSNDKPSNAGAKRLEKEREMAAKAAKAYAYHQGNMLKIKGTREAILKGLEAGEDVAGLLLIACEAIGVMVGDRAFYEAIEKRMKKTK